MKIEYSVAGGGGGYSVLYDESLGQVSPTYNVTFADKVEENPGFGASSSGLTPNGNTVANLEIPLSVSYATPAAAKAGIRIYRTTLKGKLLNLKVTVDADVDYWPNANLRSMTAKLSGKAVDYTFTFASWDVTNVEPA